MPAQEPASQFNVMGSWVNAREDSGFAKMPEFFIFSPVVYTNTV